MEQNEDEFSISINSDLLLSSQDEKEEEQFSDKF